MAKLRKYAVRVFLIAVDWVSLHFSILFAAALAVFTFVGHLLYEMLLHS